MPPGYVPGEMFLAFSTEEGPGEDLGHAGKTKSMGWPWNGQIRLETIEDSPLHPNLSKTTDEDRMVNRIKSCFQIQHHK